MTALLMTFVLGGLALLGWMLFSGRPVDAAERQAFDPVGSRRSLDGKSAKR